MSYAWKTRVLCLSGEKIQFPVYNFLAEPPRSVLTAQEAEVVHTAVICFKMIYDHDDGNQEDQDNDNAQSHPVVKE